METFLNLFYTWGIALAEVVASFLPNSHQDMATYNASISMFMDFGHQLNFIIPWQTLFTLTTLYISIQTLFIGLKVLRWMRDGIQTITGFIP